MAHWTSTDAMRPTQCAVGYLEVDFKMQELQARAADPAHLEKYLQSHPIPAVKAPDGRLYLTDHHHMGLALVKLADAWDASAQPAARNPFRACSFSVVKDWSDHRDWCMGDFFAALEAHQLCHPFDGQGQRVARIPRALLELVDDPYRSLAGFARKAGAYRKVDVPFSEFQWADYLRDKVPAQQINRAHLATAVFQAVQCANAPGAAHLPGYIGGRAADQLPTLDAIQQRLQKRYGADDAAPDVPGDSQ